MDIRKVFISFIIMGTLTSVHGQPRRGPGPAGPSRRPEPSHRRIIRPPARVRRMVIGGIPYWSHAGLYYKLGSNGYVTVSLPLVRVIPPHHRVILFDGVVYYIVGDGYLGPQGEFYPEIPSKELLSEIYGK